MVELPVGTVTFLMTDIESSTQLWERHPEVMGRAVARHDALLADCIQDHEGVVVRSRGEGDSHFSVFDRATDAVEAAIALQQALHGEAWGMPAPLRVRVGIHTGEAELFEGDYRGSAVNRCARLRALGYGGQTLLSQATCELVRHDLPPGVGLHDLGLHRLRDLQRPEQVFQLLHPDLPSDFPPLKSLSILPNNLPHQLTNFIGREREVAEVAAWVVQTRLLTLTGAGGCGKTRLALQVAADLLDDFEEGVWLVEMSPIADPSRVPEAVADVLGVRAEAQQSLTAAIAEYLRPRPLLLLLDGCEHLVPACADLVQMLLRCCPSLRILTTSREVLGLVGETSWRVPSLSLPEEMTADRRPPTPRAGTRTAELVESPGDSGVSEQGSAEKGPRDAQMGSGQTDTGGRVSAVGGLPSSAQSFAESEAVRLFVDRARSSHPTFAATTENLPIIARICRRLDGIPLAIELAAARSRVLSPAQIDARLDDRFRLLATGLRGGVPRHQTLKAAIDWSYESLSEPEKHLLSRLSVFVGGCSLAAIEAVCADEERPMTNDERPTTGVASVVGLSSFVVGREAILDLLTHLVNKSLVLVEEGSEEAQYRMLETIRQYAEARLREAGEWEMIRERHRLWSLQDAGSCDAAPDRAG